MISIEGFTNNCLPALYLGQAPFLFPRLRSLSIAAIDFCIPVSTSANLDHLTTLVITQPFSDYPPGVYAILSFLQHTPNLETLYCKTSDIWSRQIVQNQLAINDLAVPIPLPKLTSAAVTVSGTGGDILACIDAPALHDLHLDGPRGTLMSERFWPGLSHVLLVYTLQKVAARSPELRRLAITEATLSVNVWRWLLCGRRLPKNEDHVWDSRMEQEAGVASDEIIVPFPCLETLAIRDFNGTRHCGFNYDVLDWYAECPSLTTLRRVVFRRCNQIGGGRLIRAFESLRDRIGQNRFDLEVEFVACQYVRPNNQLRLGDLGVRVKVDNKTERRVTAATKAEIDWWRCHPEVVEVLKVDESYWTWPDEGREEYPWWISDVGLLDPKESWVF